MVSTGWPVISLPGVWLLLLYVHVATCAAGGGEEDVEGAAGVLYESRSHDPWGATSREAGAAPSRRGKRAVLNLYNMVRCATGCDPLAFKGYGCYCGFLGSGYAVDGIDRCCKMHDWCYNTAECPMFLEYFVPYLWKCYHHRPICALDQDGLCAQRLCECDRQLAECLRRFPCPHTKAVCTSSPWRLLQNVFML